MSIDPSAIGALHYLGRIQSLWQQNTRSLATGLAINTASDNPAGLIAANSLSSALAALEAEADALQRAGSMASTADGALDEVSTLLDDATAVQTQLANSGALSDDEIDALQLELDSIVGSINRLGSSTTFNDQPLLDGSATIRYDDETLALDAVTSDTLGEVTIDGQTYTLADVVTGGALEGDSDAIAQVIAAAGEQVSTMRGRIGAFQTNVVDTNLSIATGGITTLSAVRSAMQDTDYAFAATQHNRLSLMSRVSLLTLGLYNRQQESVLDLLAT